MKSSGKFLIVGLIAGSLLVASFLVLPRLLGKTDQALIAEALEEAIKASKDGRPGGVLDNVSMQLSINGNEIQTNRWQAGDYIKRMRPEVTISNKSATVSGDRAEVVTPAKLDVGILGARRNFDLAKVTIILQREKDTILGVIPSAKWRVTELQVPQESVSGIMSLE